VKALGRAAAVLDVMRVSVDRQRLQTHYFLRHNELIFKQMDQPFTSPVSEPLFRQVYLGLRQAILVGNFPAGGRLPSTRDLAQQLGISRTVVLLAYDQLLAEGFAVGQGGSGTYVFEGFRNSARVRVKSRLTCDLREHVTHS
jgi:DNA-binding GntR family transcriptional regulator